MRAIFRNAALVVILASTTLGVAESAKSLYSKGRRAETRQDYIAAYGFYKQAYDAKPDDLNYRVAYERTRFYAAAAFTQRGVRERGTGDVKGAMEDFQRALNADPAFDLAQQEIDQTKKQQQSGETPQQTKQEQTNTVLHRMINDAPGPVELQPLNDDLISLNLPGEDSKKIYQTVAQIAGINVVFDPDYVGRRIPVELNRVTLNDALAIIATLSNTFWHAITPNTIYVTANNQTRRNETEPQVYKTIYLSNLTGNTSGQNEIGELQQAIRTITGIQKVQPFMSQNAIAVRGTADQVALAEKIADDFDKARPEVVVEVAIMQIRREKTKDLGIAPPTNTGGVSVGLQPPNANTTTTTPTTTGTTGTTGTTTTSSTTGNITLNTFNNLSATNFAVTIPAATLNAVVSDSNTKILQDPQVRAESGQKAELKIGDRVPVAQGSYTPGIGGLAGVSSLTSLVGTNFQYVDVGVNITMTPTVYTNSDVGLKLTIDVSSVSGYSNIGGIQQPIISQRKIDHEIRLHEGEANVLGGLFETDDIKTMKGLPILSQLPVLKYLFGEETTDKVDSEIVFVLIPHIIRKQFLDEINQRAIDVGTLNTGVDLRRRTAVPKTQVPTAENAPAVRDTRMAEGAATGTAANIPAAANTPTPAPPQSPITGQPITPDQNAQMPAASGGASPQLVLEGPTAPLQVGQTFAVNVSVNNAQDIGSVPLQVSYDPKKIAVLNVSNGDFLSKDGQPAVLVKRDDNVLGNLVISGSRPPDSPGISGNGLVYTLTLQAKQPGDAVIAISKPGARNAKQQPIAITGSQTQVTIR